MPKYRVDLKLSDGTALNAGTMEVKDAYEYAQEGGYTGTAAQYKELLANAVDKRKISLGLHTDGLIYLFIDGSPVGNGIALPSGVSGDVVGNVDSGNNIVLMGNLSDGTYTVKYEMEDGSTVNIGIMVLDSNVYYAITKNLTNCFISNSATSIVQGGSYSATISANDGYELKSVTVTMGGTNVSVTNGVINIASVTGNIVITAVAEEVVTDYNLADPTSDEWIDGYRISSSGGLEPTSGVTLMNTIPCVKGDRVRIKGVTTVVCSMYKDGTFYKRASITSTTTEYGTPVVDGDYCEFTIAYANITSIRCYGNLSGEANDVIITVNHEIE